MTSALRRLAKRASPPIAIDLGREVVRRLSIGGRQEWEYLPAGWPDQCASEGWDNRTVAEIQLEKWPVFQKALTPPLPLGIAHEAITIESRDRAAHNTIMSFAYVLALAALNLDTVSILDWGGGIGHYCLLARTLLPGVEIDYHCKDVRHLVERGRQVLPEATFYDDESCFDRRYDLVVAGNSLQYSKDWRTVLRRFADVADRLVYIANIPLVAKHRTFAVLQRPHRYGYATEYVCWFLNREEFFTGTMEASLGLLRELLIDNPVRVPNAPEQAEHCAFLFEPESRAEKSYDAPSSEQASMVIGP
jgi:putative methyltransferase (TIGR04325 family)